MLKGNHSYMALKPLPERLIQEWHPTKNGALLPTDVSAGSESKAWWLGKDCGHTWYAVIGARNTGRGCAVCAGTQIEEGINDLAATHPKIAADWHPTKNGDLLPTQITSGTSQKAWFLSKDCGHEWNTTISSRALGGGCTVCSGRTILVGYNDLPTTQPTLIPEWHPTKNVELLPTQVTAGSSKKVWWIGKECGHEWEATVANRSLGRSCPYCSGKMILQGYNDIVSQKPLIAAQWHPIKNAPLTVDQINVGSNKKAWWLNASCGHEWEMKIATRTENVLCSVCDGYIVQTGINDVAHTHPEILVDWHPTKNEKLDPTKISAGSGQKAWFLGKECGHEWETAVRGYLKNNGCVVCSGQQVRKGSNDLTTLKPELAKEWHPTKNGTLLPTQVTIGAGKKVWWLCNKGHEWEATIYSRASSGYVCPYCSGRNAIVGVNDLTVVSPKVAAEWHPDKNFPLLPNQVKSGTNKKVWWKCHKGHEWDANINGRTEPRPQGCPTCAANTYISKDEQKIADLLISHGLIIKQSDRRTVKGMEMDIYVPSKKIAIEYNGLYWHCDLKQKDTKYHFNKWLAAKNAGIQLIQIWEDEWLDNPEQLKSMLLHKLGITQQEKIFARKTNVIQVSKVIAENFYKMHHVQGYASASYYLALADKVTNEIIAVLALKRESGKALNIIRYATSKNVVGGFTKLLKYAELTYKPACFVTFSDHCVSNGGLYKNNGFIADKELAPDYRYVVKRQRQHKFGYRLKRFKDDPNLQWQDGLTERELSVLNNIPRIWDAGKTRWIRKVE